MDTLVDNYSKLNDEEKTKFLVEIQNDPIFKEMLNLSISKCAVVEIPKSVICKLMVFSYENERYIDKKYLVIENGNKYNI